MRGYISAALKERVRNTAKGRCGYWMLLPNHSPKKPTGPLKGETKPILTGFCAEPTLSKSVPTK